MGAMATTNQNDYQDSSLVETGQGQVALEESYQDESYDYGNYEEGYDDGSGMIDPNTGMPIAAGADGNKEANFDELIEEIDGGFRCKICWYRCPRKQRMLY